MYSWSLRNKRNLLGMERALTYEQFKVLSQQFIAAVQKNMGTACALEINALKAPRVYTTFMDGEILSACDEFNSMALLHKSATLDDITREVWDKAAYLDIKILPVDPEKAPFAAFGYAEFKGILPDHAVFRIQPEEACVAVHAALTKGNAAMKEGGRYISNGRRSEAKPVFF